ncbi:MAG: hypothetical protein CL394_10985 [Acidiferrobacteraceae bacterium]|nr:hypothetical protein [Acidiferrobacteraceae bacterium]
MDQARQLSKDAISTQKAAPATLVGGKAASLIRLRQAGFDVPDAVVLTTQFFEPWLSQIQASSEWLSVLDILHSGGAGQPNRQLRAELTRACEQAKSLASTFEINPDQRRQVDAIEPELGRGSYAVRSSSPEEDLAGASFAGLYETVLGVDSSALAAAVSTCFCSCLDVRVLLYKFGMTFDSLAPAIAVVVQRMVDSDISGVAFSLNPLTNDFDEMLINASWGLGEALVTGDITPDSVVLDKVTDDVITHRAGDKGGDRSGEKCLADDQICELAAAVKGIETLYAQPVDVEWAFAGGHLRVLQARPITTYVPLHESLQTAPGEPRHLYMDGYLTDGMTMSVATTPMSDDVLTIVMRVMAEWAMGIPAKELDLAAVGVHMGCSRMYLDVSMYMHLMGKGEAIAKQGEAMSPMMAGILTSPDIERYRLAKPPALLRIYNLLRYLPGILWRTRRAISVLFGPMLRRDRFDANYAVALKEFDEWITRPMDYSESLTDCLTDAMNRAGSTTIVSTYPACMYFYVMTFRIKALVDSNSPEQVAWADAVCGGYEDDMIVHMGLTMYDLSTLLPKSEFEDIEALAAKVQQRSLPQEFLARWDEFVRRFGCRGPLEMEIANPKYGDAPGLALQQIASIATAGSAFNPHDMQRTQVARREQAYQNLLAILPPRKAKRLKRFYATCHRYAASREFFKHHIMQGYARLRKLLLYRADEFIREGRLGQREQIFELTIEDVDLATKDPAFDLRAAVAERGAFYHTLKSQVRHFPMAIDSRGQILRSPVEYDEGALVGAAVSPGVARGPIKVLNDPAEKEVEPGDVLVAVTTDPGWTPLFIPAAAVILEVGGELQHGALVAREYGKPCVSGIPDITKQFHDGQIVEVDGDAGVIRFVDTA